MISISFIVVLLATYSYSLPIKPEFDSTTPETQFTTGKTIVDNDITTNTHLIPDSETPNVPNLHTQRSLMLDDTNETKTFNPHEHHQHGSRAFEESTISTSTILTSEIPTTPLTTIDSQTTKFSFTTMETKSNFEKKAIMPLHHDSGEEKESESKHDVFPEHVHPTATDKNSVDITTTTNKIVDVTESRVSTEQTTSGHLFSTITGQIKDKREEEPDKSEAKREEESDKSEAKREEESDKSETKREEESDKSEAKREEESDKSETKREEESDKSETKREEESDKSEAKREEESDKSETKREEELEKSETKREEESDKSDTKREEELEKSETTPLIVKTKLVLPDKVTKTEVKFVEKQPMGDKKNTDN